VTATGNKYLLEMFAAMWDRGLSIGDFGLPGPDQFSLTLAGHSTMTSLDAGIGFAQD
jgi:hypothetical protein